MRLYGIDYKGLAIQYLAARDKGRCTICGEKLNGNVDIDHIVPVKDGGTNESSNLRVVHSSCHKARHASMVSNGKTYDRSKFTGRRGDKITDARRIIVQEIAPKILEARASGKNISEIAREWRISRPTLYEYMRRYKQMQAQMQ